MLSPKYFSKFLYYISHFDIEEFCDYCNESHDCRIKPSQCPLIINEKAKWKLIDREEFTIEKSPILEQYFITNGWRTIAIDLGCQQPKFKEKFKKKKEISYITIKCSDLKYDDWYPRHFKWGKNGYRRDWVYFAFKVIKDPEILVPWCTIAPLVIRNDKLTINIAPLVDE